MGDKDKPLSGFSWKYGSERHTTGINIWSDVFLYDAPNGDKIAILLMDTQGLFDHRTSTTNNSRIFSLSTLMSSMQIYNLTGHIHENELQYLQFATDLAKFVTDGNKPFQNLMFLIRDWQYAEEKAFGLNGGQELLDQILQINESQAQELKSLRQYIYKSFEKISCFLMPHPGKTVATQSNFDGSWSKITPEFVTELKSLLDTLLAPENLAIKTIKGEPLRAKEFYSCILQYVEMYKSGGVPETQTIYEANVTNHMKNLVGRATDVYNNILNTNMNKISNNDEIYVLHDTAKSKATEYFESTKKMGTEKHATEFLKVLSIELKNSFAKWKLTAENQVMELKQHQLNIEIAAKEKESVNAERLKLEMTVEHLKEKLDALQEELSRSAKIDYERINEEMRRYISLIEIRQRVARMEAHLIPCCIQ